MIETNLEMYQNPEEFAQTQAKDAVMSMKQIGQMITDIASDHEYTIAGEFLRDVAKYKKNIVEYFSDIKKRAYDSWKAITAKENEAIKPVDEEDKRIRGLMLAYKQEQDRKAEQERRRVAAEREAEKQRLMEEAMQAEADGNTEKMDALLDVAELVEASPAPVAATVKADGTHTRKSLDFRVIDDTKIPAYFNGIKLRDVNDMQIKKALSLGITGIPGIEIYTKETLVVGR